MESHLIAVWYHCKLSGTGIPDEDFAISIMAEQMSALKQSGLADAAQEIHIGVNGNDGQGLLAGALAPEKSIIYAHGSKARGEHPTFALLRQWIRSHLDWFVLYHHSKGVTQREHGVTSIEYKTNHRRSMEQACVWNWRQCVKDLERGFDAVGVNWVDPITRPVIPGRFFAGNFWWAKADFLASLPPIPDKIGNYDNLGERMQTEAWIGSGLARPKVMDYERPHLSEWCRGLIARE